MDLETNIIYLESNLKKLKLLNDNLRQYYFDFDCLKDDKSIVYYYDNAVIQCDIINDYIEKIKEISSNIQNLIYA